MDLLGTFRGDLHPRLSLLLDLGLVFSAMARVPAFALPVRLFALPLALPFAYTGRFFLVDIGN